MARRFVVMSNARCGTSLLTETLNRHAEIICHGEIFHPDPYWHLKGNLGDLSLEEKIALQQRGADFIEAVFDQPGVAAVGMKMWRDQSPEWCQTFLEDDRYSKVIYERPNKLAQFSSGLLARATGVWNLPPGRKVAEDKVPKLAFDERAFLKFIEFQKACFAHYRAAARGPVLEVGYETIAGGEFSAVLRFLGVADVALPLQKARLHTARIIDRFEEGSHGAILRVLDRMGCESWIEE